MKKILALLSMLITALLLNIKPAQVDDVSFTPDSYYNGSYHTDVSYKEMYSSYIEASSLASDGCDTNPVSAGSLTSHPTSNSGRYWFIYENISPLSDLVSDSNGETSLKASDGQTIIAPARCVIATSANTSRNGTRMTITIGDGKYRITFYNMARWYCCRNRKPSMSKDITATFTHTKDAKGQTLQQGDILGYATQSTSVVIEEKSGDDYELVSTSNFYN